VPDKNQDDAALLFGSATPAPVEETNAPTGVAMSTSDSDLLFGKPQVKSEEIGAPTTPNNSAGNKDSDLLFGSNSINGIGEDTHTQIESKAKPSDPNAPWYEKLWDFSNAPIIDSKWAKDWLGLDVEHWNGWGKGLFDLASGLTSPLSIALAIGTFGTSALEGLGLKAAGKAALEGIMSAEDIGQVTKGSELLAHAIKVGDPIETAYKLMPLKGIDPEVVARGLGEIDKLGLNPSAMLANGIVRRTGGAMLRAVGMDIATADKVANWSQFAIDAGFTAQNAYGAAIAIPRALDAIKEGDYETAKQLLVEGIGSGIFATLGANAAHQHAGELMTATEAAGGLRVKPSEENLKLIKLLEPVERERIVAGEREKQWEQSSRKEFDIPRDKKWVAGGASESDLRARIFRESEGKTDPSSMVAWHDAIAEAAGREGEKITAGWKPEQTADFPPDVQEWIERGKLKDKPKEYVDQLLKASDPRLLTEREIKYAKHVGDHFDETGERALGDESLSALFDSYVTRIWKNPEEIDTVKKFRTVANSPDFSINTSMARRRVFESTLEGLLKGHELENHDMVSLAAHNGNEFSRISSHRQFLNRLRGSGARGSDGRPMGAIYGVGHVIESIGPDGETVNPGTIINIKGAQNIRMADKVVEGLKQKVIRPETPKYAYRLRDIGEEGVQPEGHAQLTTRFEDTTRWRESRSNNPQEIVRLNMSKLKSGEFESKPGPNGGDWVTLKRPLRESEVERLSDDHKPSPQRDAFTDLDRLMKEGRVVKIGVDKRNGKDMYAWTTHDYGTVDHPAFRGWKVAATDTDGNPIYINGEMRVHPEALEYLNRRFADESVIRKIPGAKTALNLAREAKGFLLALSPFHFAQEGLRAIMTGISPIGSERFNASNPLHVLAAEKGVWEVKDYKGVRAYEDGLVGHSKVLNAIPGLREIQSWTQSMLFDRYIPGLKLRSFERLYNAYKDTYKDWSPEKVAEKAADDTNNRFGGISYKRMGRSAATMDVARLVALAPDWLESEMRFMGSMFGSEGKIVRRDVAKMALGMWAVARVLNYLSTGKPHNEAPFGVAYADKDGKEKVYSVRTLPTDMLHAASSPLEFMNGRMSPLLKTGIQTYTGRDDYGRKMSTNGIFVNLLRNVAPISAQNIVKQATGENTGLTNTDAMIKSAGGTVVPYRTEGQKLAAKLSSDHSQQGVVEPDKLRRHQMVIELEQRVRSGQTPISDIYGAVESGQLHRDEAKHIVDTVKETQGLDPEAARFYAHVKRLPLKEALQVWDSATNEEHAIMAKLMIKKKQAYIKNAAKNMSPAERESDSVYQRLRKMFPNEPPF
jgi:hypothetical protein